MRLALITLLVIVLVSCGRVAPANGLIVSPGSYPSPSGLSSLTVTVTANGIVNYSVTDVASKVILFSHGGFSTYHRWSFFWGQNDQLWTQNSDMGPFAVWSRGTNGQWEMNVVDEHSPLLATIPKPVYDYLPSTLKKRLKIDSGLPNAP